MKSQPDYITALDLPETPRDQLPADYQKYFAVCEEKLGMVPNVLRAYSQNAAQLDVFSRFYNELMFGESGLSDLEKEMIAVAVSSSNRCYYCQVAHGAAVRQYSEDPKLGELMVMNYRVAELSERHRAMLDFATTLSRTPEQVNQASYDALYAQGFDDEDIWDITAVTAFFGLSNRMAIVAAMQANTEFYTMAREPRQ